MAGNGRNSLRSALQERGWSYTRLAAELRRHAAGAQLPKTESLIRLISRWVNNHQQPDHFYRDLLAKALGRSHAELFHDEGTQTELGVAADLLSCPMMWPISLGVPTRSTSSVAGCSAPTGW
jgi:transcriptional regulator with XRE-family HTH domain